MYGKMLSKGCSHTNMYTGKIVTNAWFCVSNILEKNKELQMELFLDNVIFNVLVYIL
jgi:hypothetical protein